MTIDGVGVDSSVLACTELISVAMLFFFFLFIHLNCKCGKNSHSKCLQSLEVFMKLYKAHESFTM